MKNIMSSLITFALAVIVAAIVPAASYGAGDVNGTIVDVRIDKDGRGIVTFGNQIGGTPPSCQSSFYTGSLAFDTNTAGGKAIYAMALQAKATGVTVNAHGTGACSVYGNWIEDWSYGQM